MPQSGFRRISFRRIRHSRHSKRISLRASPCLSEKLVEELRMEPQIMDDTGIRHELVSRIREEIRNGTYESSAKLEAAFTKMLLQYSAD